MHYSRLVGIAAKAVEAGGSIRGPVVHFPAAGDCEAPVYREITARRPIGDLTSETVDNGWRSTVEIDVRCRKCAPCLRHRARLWRARAKEEIRLSERTWFGTLTIAPEHQFRFLMQALRDNDLTSSEFERLSQHAQFLLRHQQANREVTLFLKRLRKQTKARCRYICVAEAHKSGLPHLHLLVHQGVGPSPVRYRDLQDQWRVGFSSFKLADDASAAYVCKYLTKSLSARVRASKSYGQAPSGLSLPVGDVNKK